MTKHPQTLALVIAFALSSASLMRAQDKPAAPAAEAKAKAPFVPLKVQVVISRYQGEKKVSSMPYNLSMNAGNRANLRMGTKIPVVLTSGTDPQLGVPKTGDVNYQDVGTNIDCGSIAQDDGRFLLSITVDDSSVYPGEQVAGAAKGNPSFRSFRAMNSMVLKHGETGQFATAIDKVSGEIVKIDVTLTVLK